MMESKENIQENVGNNIQDEPQENPQKHGNKERVDSLCWNCKKALNIDNSGCCWATRFKPIKGWKTIEGSPCRVGRKHSKEKNLIVIECPEYEQYHKFLTFKEVVLEVVRTLEISTYQVLKAPVYCFQKYEKQTREKLPQWAFMEAEELPNRKRKRVKE